MTSLKWGGISGGAVLALGLFILSTYVVDDIRVNAENISDLKITDVKILEKINNIESDIVSLEGKFDNLEGKFDNLEGKFDNLEGKFDELDTKFDNLEKKIDLLISKSTDQV